ncbi:MAG: hypothetical protein LC731_08295 [Acidobacteria bacterium]|nr:hypothetical protein [Acidobacteriota bacterium]
MKRVGWLLSVLLMVMLATAQATQAQSASKFDGDWVGTISTPEGQELSVRLVIRGGAVSQYFRDETGWRPVNPNKMSLITDRNNAVVVWLNAGGVWSETQVYSLSYKSNGKLDIVWTRHVNNIKEGGENETWNVIGAGTLRKVA